MIEVPKLKETIGPDGTLLISCWRQDDGTVGLKHEQIEEVKRRCKVHNGLIDLANDLLSGIHYLRKTKQIPYGFGIDRLEKKAAQALAEEKK